MENYQGDLADIIRAGYLPISGTLASTTTAAVTSATVDSWQLQADPTNFQEDFGLPFSNDPLLLNELDMSLFTTTSSSNNLENDTGGYYGNFAGAHKVIDHNNIDQEESIIKTPCNNNIFSRMLQISPNNAKLPIPPLGSAIMAANSSTRLIKVPPPSLILPNEHLISVNGSKVASCLIENTGLQISSPRNSGVKRRKSQAKKVVCIPAPAPANSRPTGEIVPYDLWAWRKYGQKPIKGSPYPRGYYRCSSSKGCSARKQVERSRTDPNMLVITYTSEHNHPWPTQRNALAGSTRSSSSSSLTTQSNKHINPNTTNSKNSPTTSLKAPESTPFKQEKIETNNNDKDVVLETETTNSRTVKEEEMEEDKELMEMDDGDQLSEEFGKSYKPSLPVCNSDQDFFAELGEIECDPLDILFTQGFCGDHEDKELVSNKGLGSFNFYDWSVGNGNGNGNNNTSFGDASKKRL